MAFLNVPAFALAAIYADFHATAGFLVESTRFTKYVPESGVPTVTDHISGVLIWSNPIC
jgi:hypothetical protein